MKKLKLYLDTSVISHLDEPDRLDWERNIRNLWEAIQAGEYEAYLSPIVIGEVMDCMEPKRSVLLEYLSAIQYTELLKNDEVLELAGKYLEAGILRQKSFDDCQHIAYACVYNCDVLVSWNFKHMVNIKTISGVKSVNALAGYREMPIYTPTVLISGGAEDDT